ncbi:class E sortase [Streptomyces sp. AK02-04a]|uniref:class E sortase n=1 Tax=Streptomyces sp. AK02-04a TaxID=3028649 RepID=UPI0029A1A232|nr:class E sortase [Streptomyces sp. AK02-04a]MDX3764002.1 class E sortase [Streptomyces sp. AK02-04a]
MAGGLALGGYTAWLVWGTSPQPSRPEQARIARVERDLTRSTPSPESSTDANAVMRIPALGTHWAYPVYNGTTTEQLEKGLGHYTGTVGPGQIGNYAVAGHRSSNSGFEPFADLPDRVKPGDQVIVAAPTGRYTYTVTSTQQTTPDAVQVLHPDQGRGANPRDRLITLTTCTPRYGSTGRFIVYGRLTSSRTPK